MSGGIINSNASNRNNVSDFLRNVECDTTPCTPFFKCAIIPCPNIFEKFDPNASRKFHNFPVNAETLNLWLQHCRVSLITDSIKVCSDHFLPNDYEQNSNEADNFGSGLQLKSTAVPSQLFSSLKMDIANFSKAEGSTRIIPNQSEVHTIIDEHLTLKNKYKTLLDQQDGLLSQINQLDRKIVCRSNRCISMKNKNDSLKKRSRKTEEQKNMVSKIFSRSQINILLGKQKVVWSHDDMAMGFILRQMGTKECYLYLKNKLNIPLPSLSSIQRWAASI